MPRAARYALIWSMERGVYELYERGNGKEPVLRGEEEEWYEWLAAHASFAFQGQDGRLNLLKEARKSGGQGYWYAYRSQGGRTVKRYVGSTEKLTMKCLEGTARAFSNAVGGIEREEVEEGEKRGLQGEQDRERRGESLDGYEGRGAARQGELLMPKLQLPRLYSALVVRERLLALLDKGLEQRLTLLAAPAGAGKTTLVRQWIAERSEREGFAPVAWVSLDAGDNDPVRFW